MVDDKLAIVLFVVIFLFLIGIGVLMYQTVRHRGRKDPTWKGIIISTLFGMLPLYLIFCYLGLMGKTRLY